MKKKLVALGVLCGLCGALFAQQVPDKEAAPPRPADLTALQTAYSLAKYGYSVYSASALIGAAEILAKTPIRTLDAKPEAGAAAGQSSKPEFIPATLLADGKKYAAGDAAMLAWADKVEKSLGAATRGAAIGPQEGVALLNGNSNITYKLPFKAGQDAYIYVSGDGSTDLDLYIYDEKGNLISYDERDSDECEVLWRPKWTGAFIIKVVNRGRASNRFYLATN
jgi:hypothetical protein